MVDIKGYEGLYAITEDGKVWSYRSHKYLKPQTVGAGYQGVTLCVNGQKKCCMIHQLVALAYIANPDNLPEINHKDEDKTNNCVSNLRWVTDKENCNHGTRLKRIAEKHKKPVLCVELNQVFESVKQASEAVNINRGNLSRCCKGKAKTCGGYHWQYV